MPPGISAGLGRRKRAELLELLELLRPCIARVEPWLQAGKYAAALTSQIPRRNGWPPRRCVVRRFAVAGLDQAAPYQRTPRPSGRRDR